MQDGCGKTGIANSPDFEPGRLRDINGDCYRRRRTANPSHRHFTLDGLSRRSNACNASWGAAANGTEVNGEPRNRQTPSAHPHANSPGKMEPLEQSRTTDGRNGGCLTDLRTTTEAELATKCPECLVFSERCHMSESELS